MRNKILNEQPLNSAVLAIKNGVDVERVCRALNWKGFENLVALAFEQHDYRVKKHFRFKGSKRNYEIDVVGIKEPVIFSVECKRWKRSWRRAATIDAIQKQVERTTALVQYITEPKNRLGIETWKEVRLIPLVLTLSNTPVKLFNGVPVIPIYYFNSFMNNIQKYMDEVLVLSKPKAV